MIELPAESELNAKLHAILKDTFGYTAFRFEQLKIIQSILAGRDTLAIMPTGGGKSLCYQIPALYLEGATLVVSPLISLMQDQVINLNEQGVEACFLNSSLSGKEKYEARKKILNGEVKLIYVSPEGILSPDLGEFFEQVKISLIAIDEAHCVSQWGHEFRKDYTRLHELKQKFPGVPLIALTATADEKTRVDITNQLAMNRPEVFISSFDRPNIKYLIQERQDELKQLDTFIHTFHPNDTGIVYCLSRQKVEALVKLGYPAVAYHAGLPQQERTKNQARFNRDEKIIVVATIAFGMGIDRPDVRFVAHLDLPKSIESYYQETGRAGRDGKPSSAWMIYGLQDVVKLSQMLETTEADESYKKVARYKLDSMLALCEAASCRRKYLLGYFGEADLAKRPDRCDFCDTCITPPVLWDATVDAQKMLSTIYRTGQMFGAGHIIDVLRGSKNAKISDRKHDQLTVYGLGKEKPKEHWNSVLRQLLNLGYVMIKNWEYRSLGLTQKCQEILSGGKKLELRKQEFTLSKKDKRESRTLGKADASGSGRTIGDASHGRVDLFGALKELRYRLAKENNVPPYVIFSDKSLHEMCNLLPKDLSEFLMVSGVGQNKQEKYGEIFIKTIRENS